MKKIIGMLTRRMSGMQILTLGFFIIVLIGAFLLMLPLASRTGTVTPFGTTLFTSTSATCVTGLVLVDTFTHWSLFGQIVILCLIQIGGLGFITFGVAVSLLLKRRIGLKQRGLLRESMNVLDLGGIVRLTLIVVKGTIIIEGAGAVILSVCFIPRLGIAQGIYYGVFHSISAFCNAGFDLMGRDNPFVSLTGYNSSVVVILTIGLLIIVGGIGFFVWGDIVEHKWHIRSYALHTKLALTGTIILVFGGTVLFFILEHNQLFADMNLTDQLINSFFCSVSPRTAGFNSIDTASLTEAGKLLTIFLMFIGGCPGSTAGGIKVTTIIVLILYLRSMLMRTESINVYKRRLETEAVSKSAAVFCTNLFCVLIATFIICSIQKFDFMEILFEVVSAISTVGVSLGATTHLNQFSQLIIIFLMFIGRLGSLSFALSFTDKKKLSHVRRPAEHIMLG